MRIPEYVAALMVRLEEQGFECFCVGGCVRDHLLGIAPHDYDLCTNARPDALQALFADHGLVLAGLKHGTVGVVTGSGVVEITTYRTEGGYADARHPDWVRFVSTVEEDLSRRDFTVNAMAYSPARGLRDPFGGEADLRSGILRCVGDPEQRFREDALRILRGLRFSARFGLTVHPDTYAAMLTQLPGLDRIARERIFSELCGLLLHADVESLGVAAPILCRVIPELEPTLGFQQHSPHHAYDVFTHICQVVAGVPPRPELRLAALLHDAGKPRCFTMDESGRGHFYGHAALSEELAAEVLARLKAPTALKEEVLWLIRHHMDLLSPDRKVIRRALSRQGEGRIRSLLLLQRADMGGKGTGIESEARCRELDEITACMEQVLAEQPVPTVSDLAVGGRELMALGVPAGPELGRLLKTLLEAVLAEEVPNEREALLELAVKITKNQG